MVIVFLGVWITYTMMLLMGMWMSLTKNPMKPMMANPIAVAMAIFWNSRQQGGKKLIYFFIIKKKRESSILNSQ